MIIDGSHRSWGLVTLTLLFLSTGSYVAYSRYAAGGPRGGSVPGMLYGIVGSGLMLYAGSISARKKFPRWRIGTAQGWLRGHIWLGLLSVPLILFHAGFRWGGLLEQVLLVIMAAIVVSGLVGLAVQQFLPGQMTVRVPRGTFYAQIPHECRLLQLEGDVAVAGVSSPLEMPPDLEVATPERLKNLGVKEVKDTANKGKRPEGEQSPADRERQKHQRLLASIYRLRESHNGDGETAAFSGPKKELNEAVAAPGSEPAVVGEVAVVHESPAAGKSQPDLRQEASDASAVGSASPPPKKAKPSAAEMLAAARAKKAAQQAAGEAAEPVGPLAARAETAAAASLPTTTGPSGAANPESPAPTKKAKPLAAEMLAAARAKKAAQQAVGETPAASSEPATDTPQAALPEVRPTPDNSRARPADSKKAKPSAAEMLAAARAKKAAQQPAASAGEPQTEAGLAKPIPQAAVKHVVAPPIAEREAVSPAVREYCLQELRGFYVDAVRPFLGERSRTSGPLGNDVTASGLFAAKKAVWPDDLGAVVERLADLCETRRQLAVQERMHRWLHGWLFVHVPLSMCLLGLGILHAVLSLYY